MPVLLTKYSPGSGESGSGNGLQTIESNFVGGGTVNIPACLLAYISIKNDGGETAHKIGTYPGGTDIALGESVPGEFTVISIGNRFPAPQTIYFNSTGAGIGSQTQIKIYYA